MSPSLIQQAYAKARNYPELAALLIAAGVRSYTVDTATSTILYRFADGEHLIHEGKGKPKEIGNKFQQDMTQNAIRDNQQGKTDYPGFMEAIAKAGVRFYEATLEGPHKR